MIAYLSVASDWNILNRSWRAKNLVFVDPKKVSDDIRRLTTKEFRDGLSEVVEFTSQTKEPVILTNHGKDRAALVSVDDLSVYRAD